MVYRSINPTSCSTDVNWFLTGTTGVMAVCVPSTRLLRNLPCLFIPLENPKKPFSSLPSSSSSEDIEEDEEETRKILPLESSQSPLVDRFYSFIYDHHRKVSQSLNPNSANLHIPSLASDFSHISPLPLSPSIVFHTIERSARLRHGIPWQTTLSFFNWAASYPGFILNEGAGYAYVEVIDLLGKVKQFDLAWSLIDSLAAHVGSVSSAVFLSLIQRYARAGLGAEAVHAFNRMEDYGCQPDSFVFASTIGVLAKRRHAETAQSFFDSLKHKFQLDVVIYSALIHGWCRVHRIDEAERIFSEMQDAGIKPNVYTYTIVIDGLCRSGRMDRGYDVFRQMVDSECSPNAATFNSLISAHVKANQTERALQVYNQMKRLSCNPDEITYNFLIEAYCRNENLDAAMKILNQMVSKGCQPNGATFNPLFRCLAKAKDVNASHGLFSKMKDLKCKPNTVTYNILMRMFSESKSVDMVMKLKKEMDENHCEPNVNTYRVLISMFCSMGHWNRAYKLLKEMVEEKCLKPTVVVHQMVLEQLRKAGQIEKHEELVAKMIARGFMSRPL